MAHQGKNKSKRRDTRYVALWFINRVKKQRIRNKIAKLSRRRNRNAN